jgi:hypothetical protein
MQNLKRALVLPESKKTYGPIASGLIQASLNRGIDVRFFTDDLTQYDYLVIFENRFLPRLKTNAKIGLWQCDLRTPSELPDIRGKLNVVFLCNTEYTKLYKRAYRAEIHYMPQCGIPWKVERGRHIQWDVSFLGNFNPKWHHNRMEVIKKIKEKYNIHVMNGSRFTPDSAWIYNETPFNLSISLNKSGYTSNRTYNILSAGGFCLIAYFDGIEKLFENHKHLVWFKTPEEAVEIIDYYYEHEEEYAIIKAEGKKLYDKKHTARHRIENMFGILEGRINDFQGYL